MAARYSIALLFLLQGCAYQAPPLPPVMERREGMTILILNPYDCDELSRMTCAQRSGLEYICSC